MTDRNDLGKILKQRRVMIPMTLLDLARATGISSSHLGRIERGDRFPSGGVLRRIAEPLGYAEDEIFTLAGFLSPKPSEETEGPTGQLDPYVATLLSEEPVETQRAVIGILSILKSIARGSRL